MRKEEAYRNIHYCTAYYIGGLENMESDYRGTEDGDAATAELNDHNALVENIMHLSVTGIYGAGYENRKETFWFILACFQYPFFPLYP